MTSKGTKPPNAACKADDAAWAKSGLLRSREGERVLLENL